MSVLDRVGRGADPISLQEAVIAELEDQGYEPRSRAPRHRLGNCPFHSLAVEYTDLVCRNQSRPHERAGGAAWTALNYGRCLIRWRGSAA